jgi:hypothetical protein
MVRIDAVFRLSPRVIVDERVNPAYLHQVTLRVIPEAVYADASEAQEVSEALPPNRWKRWLCRQADFVLLGPCPGQ